METVTDGIYEPGNGSGVGDEWREVLTAQLGLETGQTNNQF